MRGVAVVTALLVVAGGGTGTWLYREVWASLPQLDGEVAIAGLAAPLEIERDELGVPTVHAASREDAARALGFLHAQDRFFQMDLLRRRAAGEMAEIFGAALVKADERHRIHRFRERARRVLERTGPEKRALLEAYGQGVNAGLASLAAPPFEYVLTRNRPAAWAAEDTVLVVFAMFLELQGAAAEGESNLGLLSAAVPEPMFRFLAPLGTEWDAPLVGEAFWPPRPSPARRSSTCAGRRR